MKKVDVLLLTEVFTKFGETKYGVKFSYFLAKNKIAIKSEVDALEEARKPDQEFLDFEVERMRAAQELCDKDESGNPIVVNGAFSIKKEFASFDKKMNQLKQTYKTALEKREAQIKEFQSILSEDYKIPNAFKISIDDLPKDIEPNVVELFITSDLIKED